ncbi:MAG: hypothetical protein ABSC77_12205 [Terracidiphilus sp.]|jgi:hypothetical protein
MKSLKGPARQGKPRLNHGERVKDEVYRQMFRLEERRPGAEIGLAIALLHAWLTAESNSESGLERVWLKNISPICLLMIETSLQATDTVSPCAQ